MPIEQITQSRHAAVQKPRNRRLCAAHLRSHLRQRNTLQVMQDYGRLLVGRQLFEGGRQAEQLLMAAGPSDGGGVVGGEVAADAGGQVFEGTLQGGVVLGAAQAADFIEQVAGEDLLEPGEEFGLAGAAKAGKSLVCFEERLLDDAGEVELAAEAGVEVESGAQAEVGAVGLESVG